MACETLGCAYVAEEMFPRFDLVHGLDRIGYVESSRYCNFRCSFCAPTGEGRPYQPYDLNYIRRQILAIGRRQTVLFIDNNFYGNDRDFFAARLALLTDLRARGELGEWSALVTGDFSPGFDVPLNHDTAPRIVAKGEHRGEDAVTAHARGEGQRHTRIGIFPGRVIPDRYVVPCALELAHAGL